MTRAKNILAIAAACGLSGCAGWPFDFGDSYTAERLPDVPDAQITPEQAAARTHAREQARRAAVQSVNTAATTAAAVLPPPWNFVVGALIGGVGVHVFKRRPRTEHKSSGGVV